MGALQLLIEAVLIGLLGASLVQAIRMERSHKAIKRDRTELERLILGFDDSNRQAEAGAERLRLAADAAGRTMARQVEDGANLKDDLSDLIERGERLVAQLGGTVRSEAEPHGHRYAESEPGATAGSRLRSQAERELLRALRVTR